MRFEISEEIVAGEERRTGVLQRGRGRRARASIEERKLAEELPRPHDRHEGLLAELAGERDLHPTVQNHVQVCPRVILAKDHLAPFEALRTDALRELRELAVGEAGEEGKPPKVLGHALLGHPPDSTRGT